MNSNVIWQHLSDPEYLHVLLNPLPVYGLSMGLLALVIALISRSRAARLAALAIVFVSALSAWPVYHYGQAGYDRVLSMSDDQGGKWLEEHMRRAEKLIYVFYGVAALAALAVSSEWKLRRAAVPLGIATLVLASANLGVGGYIGYAGGHVRHKEFRFEPAPEPAEAEHHHPDGTSDEHAKSEAPKPMDHGAMPGMEADKSSDAKEQPMQHDAAAQPAAPNDEQLEASRLQLEASRLQLEASRKQLEAVDAAKAPPASPTPAQAQPTPTPDGHNHKH